MDVLDHEEILFKYCVLFPTSCSISTFRVNKNQRRIYNNRKVFPLSDISNQHPIECSKLEEN